MSIDFKALWQPIATAPRDGSDILLFIRNQGAVEGRFCWGEWSEHHEYGPEYSGSVWSCADDEFQIEVEEYPEDCPGGPFGDGNATHWMPRIPWPDPIVEETDEESFVEE